VISPIGHISIVRRDKTCPVTPTEASDRGLGSGAPELGARGCTLHKYQPDCLLVIIIHHRTRKNNFEFAFKMMSCSAVYVALLLAAAALLPGNYSCVLLMYIC
jgi:hypothetical protein